jgi:hypothetical protein
MARKGSKKGGSSAARSAAAKKGWETRRRGGAKAKPAATKRTVASKPRATPASKPTERRGMPKTTSARGRALTNQRRAADLVRASRGGKGPSAKAVRSVLTAQRARAFYDKTGGGKKRSAVKAKSAAKIGKSIRAQGRAKATAARGKVAGRPRAGAKPVAAKAATKRPRSKAAQITSDKIDRIAGRINNVVNNTSRRTGVKALNTMEAGVRAKSFFARTAGGVGKYNALPRDQKEASARASLAKPPKYSTQKPNRNKPSKYNQLGQNMARAKALQSKPAATLTPAAPARPAAPSRPVVTGPKLSSAQRSQATAMRRKYGESSTVARPGRRSQRASRVPTSSGQRLAATGRNRAQAGAAQVRRAKQVLPTSYSGRRLRRVKVGPPQLNIFGGADYRKVLKPAPRVRRVKSRSSTNYSNNAPRGRYS